MGKTLFFTWLAFFLLAAMPLVSSIDITVESDYAFRNMVIRVLDGSSNVIDSLYPGKTDINGEITTNYSTTQTKLGFTVFITENGNVLDSEEFEVQTVDKTMVLDMESSPEEANVTEDTEEVNESIVVDEENSENDSITGKVISGDSEFKVPTLFYYIIGILLLAGVIGFVVGNMIREKRLPGRISEKPAMVVRKEGGSDFSRELAVAERKLKEAQNDINRLRNTDKIKQAEEKLKRDAEELEKLRKGE